MAVSQSVIKLVAAGNILEETGRHDQAEICYLRAIEGVGSDEPQYVGILYINLGTNAESAGRVEDAINFNAKASSILDSSKGEAIVQKAHAHFNLAKLMLGRDNPGAVLHSGKAIEAYMGFPFVQDTDICDAKALHIVALVCNGDQIKVKELRSVWETTTKIPSNTLHVWVTPLFLKVYSGFLRDCQKNRYQPRGRGSGNWIPSRSLRKTVLASVRGKLFHRLTLRLLGGLERIITWLFA